MQVVVAILVVYYVIQKLKEEKKIRIKFVISEKKV